MAKIGAWERKDRGPREGPQTGEETVMRTDD